MENKYRKETKYFCEYCRVWVQNNATQIKFHESQPQHKRRVEMHLKHLYREKDKAGPKQKKPAVKKSININDYGLGQPVQDFDLSEFHVTKEFEAAHRNVVETAKIGDWEPIPEEERDKREIEEKDIGSTIEASDDETDFVVAKKTLKRDASVEPEPVVFKKKKRFGTKRKAL